jgi:sirohydrochlorin ferrochelatase
VSVLANYPGRSVASSRAIILVGHGSLRPGAGAAMIRLAAHAHAVGVAPIVTAAFLNYSWPTLAETLADCLAGGATEVIVQPYFLVPGKFVRDDLVRQVEAEQAAHPDVTIHLAQPFGDHPALAELLLKRALEADYRAANPHQRGLPQLLDKSATWQPMHTLHRTGMLIMAHGSRNPRSNAPIYAIARHVRASGRYADVTVCFMELNTPSILDAIDDMVARGIQHIIAVPYFLQLGNHVIDDLPAAIEQARARHLASTIIIAEHLAYDRLLVAAITDRVAAAALDKVTR